MEISQQNDPVRSMIVNANMQQFPTYPGQTTNVYPMATQPNSVKPMAKAEKRKQETLLCEACGIEVNSQQMMEVHLRGQKHMKKMKLKAAITSTGAVNPSDIPITEVKSETVQSSTIEANSTANLEKEKVSTPSVPVPPEKSVLQTLNELAKAHKVIAKYDLIRESGPAHCKQFEVRLTLGEETYTGTGTSIKRAQQFAAERALATTQLKRNEANLRSAKDHRAPLIREKKVPTPVKTNFSSVQRKIDHFLESFSDEISENETDVEQIDSFVKEIERALKTVSDRLAENDRSKNIRATPKMPEEMTTNTNEDSLESFRMLKGSTKVSILSMHLLLKIDQQYSIVIICANKPNDVLLKNVAEQLTSLLNGENSSKDQINAEGNQNSGRTYEIETNIPQAYLVIRSNNWANRSIQILFTSPIFRSENFLELSESARAQIDILNPDPDGMLSKQKCLEAAAEIRHSNWFTNQMLNQRENLTVLKLLRFLQLNQTPLSHLNLWCLILLVNKSHTRFGITSVQLFRTVFSCLSSGVLLANDFGPGLIDPCEKELVDATAYLTMEQRLLVTNYAQSVLRQIAFGQYQDIFRATSPKTNSSPIITVTTFVSNDYLME